jgi:glycosyltransferase involved in cell wall biosynthesis
MNVDEKTGAALPRISVIIPVLDGARVLERCLAALAASALRDFEVIVVDDGSADGSAALAEAAGARVIRQARSRGAAAARNLGAGGARGEVLYFLDADVLVQPGTLSAIADDIAAGADAVIGSYTPDTPEKGFFSKFKNVHHHYIHQISSEKAVTFWTGCGAVKRDAFRAVGGFDEKIYGGATVEDIGV